MLKNIRNILRYSFFPAYHYPPDSSDSGTCTVNRSLSNSHSSLPPMPGDDVMHTDDVTRPQAPIPGLDFSRMRRAVSALSLTESERASSNRASPLRDDVIQHTGDVINDDEQILSVSMLADDERRRRRSASNGS